MELSQSELKELIRMIAREVISMLLSDDRNGLYKAAKEPYKAGKELISEKRIEELSALGHSKIHCEKGCIITPLARDRARELDISILYE